MVVVKTDPQHTIRLMREAQSGGTGPAGGPLPAQRATGRSATWCRAWNASATGSP